MLTQSKQRFIGIRSPSLPDMKRLFAIDYRWLDGATIFCQKSLPLQVFKLDRAVGQQDSDLDRARP
jgi:hypothetical protein